MHDQKCWKVHFFTFGQLLHNFWLCLKAALKNFFVGAPKKCKSKGFFLSSAAFLVVVLRKACSPNDNYAEMRRLQENFCHDKFAVNFLRDKLSELFLPSTFLRHFCRTFFTAKNFPTFLTQQIFRAFFWILTKIFGRLFFRRIVPCFWENNACLKLRLKSGNLSRQNWWHICLAPMQEVLEIFQDEICFSSHAFLLNFNFSSATFSNPSF